MKGESAGRVRHQDIEALLDPERRRAARAYARARRRLILLTKPIPLLYLLFWPLTGADIRLWLWLGENLPLVNNMPVFAVLTFFLILGLGLWVLETLLAFPGEVLARRYGLSVQTWEDWLTDRIKAGIISGILGLIAVWGIYTLLSTGDPRWWLWAGIGVIGLVFVLTILAPVVIAPLFFRFDPIEEGDVRERLLALAERAGVRATGVYRFDMSRRTRAANAAVIGMGTTRRIVVADTLLENFTPDEVETVLAHELAHHVHRDILWHFLVQSIAALVGFRLVDVIITWVEGDTWRILPTSRTVLLVFITLFVYGWLVTPVFNLWFRSRESLADLFAIMVTGKGKAYARALARLANQNLIELWPPRWYVWLFGSHPPLGERVRMALEIGEEMKKAEAESQSPISNL